MSTDFASLPDAQPNPGAYWNEIADEYQRVTRISTRDYHYGPLLPGESELRLLPRDWAGKRCLEVGCGAGQNSIWLARQGAACVALDVARGQLRHGRRLARREGVGVDYRQAGFEDLPLAELGGFDLVHSTYALPFARDQQRAIAGLAAMLAPGGLLALTTAHPLFAGEWIELEDGGDGMFLSNYFHPPADVRYALHNHDYVSSQPLPLSQVCNAILAAGLRLERLVEPEPLPIPLLDEAEIAARIPYDSPGWRELHYQLTRVPAVAIFLARK